MSEDQAILDMVDDSERKTLSVFYSALKKALKDYHEKPSKTNKQNYEVAKQTLDDKKSELKVKYGMDQGTAFPSLHEVVSHLDAAGFRISKSKIYRDKDKGMIRVNPDGSVAETEVRAYAANLERKAGDIGDMSDIQAVKTAREVEKLEEQIAKARFERELQEGKYIPKKDFEAELAARVMVLETGIKHMFNMRVREWIALVGGSAEKSAELLQQMNEGLDKQLTDYANTDRFQVMFEEDA